MKILYHIDKIEVSSILISIQQEMLKEESYRWMLQNSYDEYLATLQCKLWIKIYELKDILFKF